ncbi:MAG: hypothetical protein LBS84_01860 [Clostridiales bacterium]|jgi:hypothetical protein|nr:hypothetical protein [Clostridiales bacterium]
MSNQTFDRARAFIYRNARPLDITRFQVHFENGSKDAVLTALAAYQNEDGGFGHALEPDAWNPNSSPIQTWTATGYMAGDFLGDMHTAGCFIRLMEYAQEAGSTDIFDVAALKNKLKAQVKYSITADKSAWESGYICKPSQFFSSRDSIFYADNKDTAGYECDFILRTQQPDGS